MLKKNKHLASFFCSCVVSVGFFPIKMMIQNHSLFIDDAEVAEYNGKNNKEILRFLIFEICLIWYTLKSEKYEQHFFFRPISMEKNSGTFQISRKNHHPPGLHPLTPHAFGLRTLASQVLAQRHSRIACYSVGSRTITPRNHNSKNKNRKNQIVDYDHLYVFKTYLNKKQYHGWYLFTVSWTKLKW